MTMKLLKHIALGMCLAMMATVATGCKHKKEEAVIDTTHGDTVGDGTGGLPNNLDVDYNRRGTEIGVNPIYFDYDSDALRPDAMATLSRNAEVMKSQPANTYWRVEGNCDERGTQEYNMALGERRALSVRSHLISLGVAADHIITISYGEENPAAPGSGESAWSKNRRAEFSFGTK